MEISFHCLILIDLNTRCEITKTQHYLDAVEMHVTLYFAEHVHF